MVKFVKTELTYIYLSIGIDTPSNNEEIINYIMADVSETADDNFTSEDIRIAFRRFIEHKKNNL